MRGGVRGGRASALRGRGPRGAEGRGGGAVACCGVSVMPAPPRNPASACSPRRPGAVPLSAAHGLSAEGLTREPGHFSGLLSQVRVYGQVSTWRCQPGALRMVS